MTRAEAAGTKYLIFMARSGWKGGTQCRLKHGNCNARTFDWAHEFRCKSPACHPDVTMDSSGTDKEFLGHYFAAVAGRRDFSAAMSSLRGANFRRWFR